MVHFRPRSGLRFAAVWPDERCALRYSLSDLSTSLHLPLSCHSQLCRSRSHATCGLSFAAASAAALMQPQTLAQLCCCSLACAMAESATMSCSAASSAACHVRRAQHVRCCCTAVQRLYYYAHYTHCTGCSTPTTPTILTILNTCAMACAMMSAAARSTSSRLVCRPVLSRSVPTA